MVMPYIVLVSHFSLWSVESIGILVETKRLDITEEQNIRTAESHLKPNHLLAEVILLDHLFDINAMITNASFLLLSISSIALPFNDNSLATTVNVQTWT